MSCTVRTYSRQNLQNKNKEDLAESIGVVLAKYHLKAKLENFYNSKVPELGEITHTLICEGFGIFYSSTKLALISWWKGYLLLENISINTCNLRDPFLIGLPSIVVGCEVQDISILGFLETTHTTKVTRGCHEGDT